jgi:hypothetical protein
MAISLKKDVILSAHGKQTPLAFHQYFWLAKGVK